MRPLSARSVVLSLLLGAHPPELPVSALVDAGEMFGISDSTLRVALTRMVANGDLDRTDGSYRLSPRMLERQRKQDAALDPAGRWDGTWETVVVTSVGRSASDRAELRAQLSELRLAELREGVWLRPANLARPLPGWPADLITTFFGTPSEDPRALARRLWDLDAWNLDGRHLLGDIAAARTNAERLTVAAAVVRHLRRDPALPGDLLPADWVAPKLRAAYAAYQQELIESGMQLVVSSSS
ncbi:PaaX family transcriptional regulator C-terminal domain-containing protein [Nocardioides marmorisolisilvae]|uniref:PaaX domain-containing protein, C-domain protein n=1 Tax=Nocardioides marmorisolisilvae TaxID=1542737 RepID=A0A3N0DWY4_9ACTN|nr:PaaX family transcriptional regulator C-terminal domain-containing protein [Nocardioides marmorisolisilvae]RNL80132.1 PaaX domain-containing protein, C- domain protein [Nocardioides marmorisolisilvae]